jgi:hypothetical protein
MLRCLTNFQMQLMEGRESGSCEETIREPTIFVCSILDFFKRNSAVGPKPLI